MDNKGFIVDNVNSDINDERSRSNLKPSFSAVQFGPVEMEYTFEEAVELIGIGKFHYLIMLLCGGCVMGVVVESMSVGFLMPTARCDLQFTTTEQGLVTSAGFFGIMLSSYFWGYLADTWGRRKVMRFSLLSSFLCTTISSFSTTAGMLIGMRFLVGLLISGNQAASFSYLAEFHSYKSRRKALSFAAMFIPFGMIYLPAMAWLVIPVKSTFSSWRLYLLLCGLTNAIIFLVLIFLPDSPKFILMQGKTTEALEILQKVYRFNTGRSKEDFPVKKLLLLNETENETIMEVIPTSGPEDVGKNSMVSKMWAQTQPLFKKSHRLTLAMTCFHVFLLFFVAHGVFMWLPDILTQITKYRNNTLSICQSLRSFKMHDLNVNITDPMYEEKCSTDPLAFQILIGIGCVFTLSYFLVGLIINFFDTRKLLGTWLIICAIAGFLILSTRDFYIIQLLLLLFLGSGNCGSILSAISTEFFPTKMRGMALCFVFTSARFGAVVGSNMVGYLLNWDCDYLFSVLSGITLMCAVFCVFLPTNKVVK